MKIAILGVENSHADAFGAMVKDNPKYSDIEIVGIYSEEEDAVKRIIDAGFATYAAKTPDEFVGKVDGVVVTARHGNKHHEYAMPYVKEGIPCFIDKPFCADIKLAKELAQTAKDNGALLCGGSCVKFLDEIKALARAAASKKVSSGTVCCPVNMVNNYGGFWFYTQHLVEMLLAIHGRNVKSVLAYCPNEQENRLTVIFNFGSYDITGFYSTCPRYAATLTTEDRVTLSTFCDDVGYTFVDEFDEFVQMVKTGVMHDSYDDLVYPVKVLDAIERSYKEKKEIVVE